MRKLGRKYTIAFAATMLVMGLSACSEGTQDAAERTAESAGDDIEANAKEAGQVIGGLAEEAAEESAQALDSAAEKIHETAEEEDKEDAEGR